MSNVKIGDEFIKEMSDEFWKNYRKSVAAAVSTSSLSEADKAELYRVLIEFGQNNLEQVRGLLNHVGVMMKMELDRTELVGHLTKASIHALRAMKADSMADDIEERLYQIMGAPSTSARTPANGMAS